MNISLQLFFTVLQFWNSPLSSQVIKGNIWKWFILLEQYGEAAVRQYWWSSVNEALQYSEENIWLASFTPREDLCSVSLFAQSAFRRGCHITQPRASSNKAAISLCKLPNLLLAHNSAWLCPKLILFSLFITLWFPPEDCTLIMVMSISATLQLKYHYK